MQFISKTPFNGAVERLFTLGSISGVLWKPAGSADPHPLILLGHGGEAAASITIPVEFLVQWDDEMVPRDSALALFDAFGSADKSLHANAGGHMDVPHFEVDSSARFFARHLVTT